MQARHIQLFVLLLTSVMLLGCPDTGPPKLPTTPKVPQPKAATATAQGLLVTAPAIHSLVRRTT